MPYDHPLSVKIPRELFDQIRILALDPQTGQARYGFWPRTISMLLRRWLDEQRANPDPPPPPHEPPVWKATWAKGRNNNAR